jgi:hypothetical protein
MLNIKYKYSGKIFNLKPYTTKQEKDILLLDLLGSDDAINSALRIVGASDDVINSLSEKEKIALLYKYRSISIGDEIPLGYKCKHCNTPNETNLDINNLVTDSNITNDKIVDKFKDVTDDNIHEFINVDIDELDLDEYESIFDEVKQSITQFNFMRKNNCIKCKQPNNINIENTVMNYMSEDTLMSMYQTYNDLTFFGKYTKQDIDTLYPFERSILIGLLNKTREELNK